MGFSLLPNPFDPDFQAKTIFRRFSQHFSQFTGLGKGSNGLCGNGQYFHFQSRGLNSRFIPLLHLPTHFTLHQFPHIEVKSRWTLRNSDRKVPIIGLMGIKLNSNGVLHPPFLPAPTESASIRPALPRPPHGSGSPHNPKVSY